MRCCSRSCTRRINSSGSGRSPTRVICRRKKGRGASETLCTRLALCGQSVLEVGVEGGEAFVPAGHRAFPVALVVSDREVDELPGGFVIGEVAADADGFADDA